MKGQDDEDQQHWRRQPLLTLIATCKVDVDGINIKGHFQWCFPRSKNKAVEDNNKDAVRGQIIHMKCLRKKTW